MILKILYIYLIFTRGIIVGYFLKDKKEYKFDWEDYLEYFLKFFLIEFMILVPRILYPFLILIGWICDKIAERNDR